MLLSNNFSLIEFTRSETADRLGIKNIPLFEHVINLSFLAFKMEIMRRILNDRPITITSGYRCHQLNVSVGGSATSDHLKGLACDFLKPPGYSNNELKDLFLSKFGHFDQIIIYTSFIHVGMGAKMRRQVIIK